MRQLKEKILKRLRAVLEAMGVKFENQLPPPEERTTHIHYAPHCRVSKAKNAPVNNNNSFTRMQNK